MNSKSCLCKLLMNYRSRMNFMLETLKYVCNNNSKKIALFDPTILENLKAICRRLCKGKLCSIWQHIHTNNYYSIWQYMYFILCNLIVGSQNDLLLRISLNDLLASNKSGNKLRDKFGTIIFFVSVIISWLYDRSLVDCWLILVW